MSWFQDESNCYLSLNGITSEEGLNLLLEEYAQEIWNEWKVDEVCPDHFDDAGLEIPSDLQLALPLIMEEIQKYVEWGGAYSDGASVCVRCASESEAEDSDFFESICLFLFAKSTMPYFLMRSTSMDQHGGMISHHRIGYILSGEITLEQSTDFLDRVFSKNICAPLLLS